MSGMTPERLADIRRNLPSADIRDAGMLSRRERDAFDLLDEVDRLRIELEICERASLRNAQAHMAAHTEVKRLRAGIEEAASDLHVLAHTTGCTGSMCDGCQAGRIQYRLTALLNPTGGETHE